MKEFGIALLGGFVILLAFAGGVHLGKTLGNIEADLADIRYEICRNTEDCR